MSEHETHEEEHETHEATPDEETTPDETEAPDETREEEREEPDTATVEAFEDPPRVPAASVEAQKRQQDKDREKLDRENERHDKRVREIMGEDAAYLVNCPLCGDVSTGFLMVQEEGVISDEHLAKLKELLGIGLPSQLKPHPTAHRCETCDGDGYCDTGSKRAGFMEIECPTCHGKGWEGLGVSAAALAPANGSTETAAVTGPTVFTPADPAAVIEDDPQAKALRNRGWMVIPPLELNAG